MINNAEGCFRGRMCFRVFIHLGRLSPLAPVRAPKSTRTREELAQAENQAHTRRRTLEENPNFA